MKPSKIWGSLAVLAGLAFATGCDQGSVHSATIRVSAESARTLNFIGRQLKKARAEVSVACVEKAYFGIPTLCKLKIDAARSSELDAQMINHPFKGTPLTYRMAGGTEALNRALYESIGTWGPTRDFRYDTSAEVVNERVLDLEDGRVRIRCIGSKTEPAQHSCWTLIDAEILG